MLSIRDKLHFLNLSLLLTSTSSTCNVLAFEEPNIVEGRMKEVRENREREGKKKKREREISDVYTMLIIHTGGAAVIKAQVLAGGRGKGHFDSGLQGGVKLAKRYAAV